MVNNLKKIIIGIAASCALSATAYADSSTVTYEVSITNLTNAPFLSKPVVAIHSNNFKLFELGKVNTSPGLEAIAETGKPGVLVDELTVNPEILEVRVLNGLMPNGGIAAGETVTATFQATKGYSYVSVYSMVAPSNDGFVAANSVKGPYKEKSVVIMSPVYDAGTEANNELCDTAVPTDINDPDSIPVPPPMRPMICVFNPTIPAPPFARVGAGGEGPVLVHRGFQGIGDLNPAMFDWRNPSAKIMIKRISSN